MPGPRRHRADADTDSGADTQDPGVGSAGAEPAADPRAAAVGGSSGYRARHLVGDTPSGYTGRHRARPTAAAAEQSTGGWVGETYGSARRALVATTIATTLTAGGIAGLIAHHESTARAGDTAATQPPQRLVGAQSMTLLAQAAGQHSRRAPSAASTGSTSRAATGRTVHRSGSPAAGRSGSAPHGSTTRRGPAQPRRLRTRLTPDHSPTATRTVASAGPSATASAHTAATPAAHWVRPGTGPISSCFCQRWGTMHWGVDLAAPFGAPIYAAGDGVVLRTGPATGFGQAVYIQHAGGDTTVYGHMEKTLVQPGQRVRAGQLIALVGAEGESTGPHLHFEVHHGSEYGERINPGPWLAARGVQL